MRCPVVFRRITADDESIVLSPGAVNQLDVQKSVTQTDSLAWLATITFCSRQVVRVEDVNAALQASGKLVAIPAQTLRRRAVCVTVEQSVTLYACVISHNAARSSFGQSYSGQFGCR